MFPILNILATLPWRLIGASVLAAVLFAGGCQFGANRVTAKWDAEKAATAEAIAKQVEHVAEFGSARERRGKSDVAGGKFLGDHASGQGIGAGAAQRFGQGECAQSHLRRLFKDGRNEMRVFRLQAIRVVGDGLDFARHKVAHGVPEFLLLG